MKRLARRQRPTFAMLGCALAAVVVTLSGCQHRSSLATRPLDRGCVVAPEPRAAAIGAQILRDGGNAVDAAVAVHFALAVTYPIAGNIGGGGFLLVLEASGAVHALDYRETAPAAAGRDLYLDADGAVEPGTSLWSHRSAGVPGSVMGMWETHERFGALPWGDVLRPAIDLARDGFELDPWTARSFRTATMKFAGHGDRFAKVSDFARLYHGKAGERFVQRRLSSTLRRIAARGADGFYHSHTADLIAREMELNGGLITRADLAAYRAVWREPVLGTYRGRRLASMPPPSSGGVALTQLLGMLESFEPPELLSSDQIHLFAEIEKRAFADRSVYLGDSDYVDVPVGRLTDPDYLRRRAAEISPDRKSLPDVVGAGRVESEQTTHVSVVDRHGMAVSNTTTLNAAYGSGIIIDGGGFLLNNEMDDFSAKPGVPNLYGVVGAAANAIEPGKRMLSSMSPTMVFDRDGELSLILGTPGGPTIFTTIFQVLVAVVDHGLGVREALDLPRFHHQWTPRERATDPIRVETRAPFALPEATLDRLRARGYAIEERESIGDVQAIAIVDGRAVGAADRRGTGTTAYE